MEVVNLQSYLNNRDFNLSDNEKRGLIELVVMCEDTVKVLKQRLVDARNNQDYELAVEIVDQILKTLKNEVKGFKIIGRESSLEPPVIVSGLIQRYVIIRKTLDDCIPRSKEYNDEFRVNYNSDGSLARPGTHNH